VAVAIDSGEVVDGSDDGVGGDADALGAVDDVSEGEAEVAVAFVVEVDGCCVPVDGAGLEPIVRGDLLDVMPVNEFFLDILSERAPADGAEAFVVANWSENTFLHEREFFLWS
jgi:hypothetical protein